MTDRAIGWTIRAGPFEVQPPPTDVGAAALRLIRLPRMTVSQPSNEAETKKENVQRRRLTGRNVQLNIKAKQETIDQINAIADRRGWVLGEVLEHALAALETAT